MQSKKYHDLDMRLERGYSHKFLNAKFLENDSVSKSEGKVSRQLTLLFSFSYLYLQAHSAQCILAYVKRACYTLHSMLAF